MANDENLGPEIGIFETWVKKNYGGNSRTKTITSEKYLRICKLIRGEDPNSNAKFRFWVRNKGFRLLRHDTNTDEILDDPCGSLFVSLHAKEGSTPMGERSIEKFLRTNLPAISFFRKVAIVEEFYGIIKCAHVDDKGVHAGQKKTYRLVSDTYAFLPREVITHYLLNCNTCKPRIQKYGPIPSKIRMNNLARKNPPELNPSAPVKEEKEVPKNVATSAHQVIRPSPKRYRPTFIDAVVPENYPNPKMHGPPHKLQNEGPPVHIIEPRYESSFQPHYMVPGIKSHPSEHHAARVVASPLRRSDEVYKNGYHLYPSYTAPSSLNGEMKEMRGFREYAENGMRVGDLQESRKRKLEIDTKERYSEAMSSSSTYHSHFNSIINSSEMEKYMPRHLNGYRLQPYKLLQSHEVMHNYRRHAAIETGYEKEYSTAYPYCIPYTYVSQGKKVDSDYYNEKNTKYEIPSPTAYHKKICIESISDVHPGAWYTVPKYGREKLHLDRNKIDRTVNDLLIEEIRDKYAFDYDLREGRKHIGHRKENEMYSVNQYHKLVCDTVNSSLSSLCHTERGGRKEVNSPSLKVPDQAKIMKVIHESDGPEVIENGNVSS